MRKEKQLFNYLKCKVMNKKFYWLAGFAALMMTAACSDDNVVNDNPTPDPDPTPVVDDYVGEMTMYDAASQAGRVHVYPQTRALKSERLSLVATVEAPDFEGWNWSATSLYFDATNSFLYATWHSNFQTKHPNTDPAEWGGGLDVFSVNVNVDNTGEVTSDNVIPTLFASGSSLSMKFENVTKVGNNLFLSGTQAIGGGAVARVDASGFNRGNTKVNFDIIGFPGSSVNAVAQQGDGNLIAISGYTGTFGTFAPTIAAGPYKDEEGNIRAELNMHDEKPRVNWGGKYVTADGEYMLRGDENEAIIIRNATGYKNFKLGYKLLSAERSAEKYEVDENGNVIGKPEIVEGTEAQKYGKHVLVVRNGYAYVAAGWNGLRVHDLNAGGKEVRWQTQEADSEEQNNGPYTTGLFADDDYLYAATSQGLRVYTFKDDGGLELFAFEVENYDGNGAPQRDEKGNYQAAQTETEKRHSCNFVVAHEYNDDGIKYIYVAYGRSGIRVYKLNPDAEETTKPE